MRRSCGPRKVYHSLDSTPHRWHKTIQTTCLNQYLRADRAVELSDYQTTFILTPATTCSTKLHLCPMPPGPLIAGSVASPRCFVGGAAIVGGWINRGYRGGCRTASGSHSSRKDLLIYACTIEKIRGHKWRQGTTREENRALGTQDTPFAIAEIRIAPSIS